VETAPRSPAPSGIHPPPLLSLAALLLSAALIGFAHAEAPVPAKPPASGGTPAPEKKEIPLGGVTTTSGGIITVVDSVSDALRRLPKMVATPEAYQDLQEKLNRLRAELDRLTPLTPSTCRLKGKVEGSIVTLQIQYEFATETPGQVVSLGGAPARATGVTLDGRLPRLLPEKTRGIGVASSAESNFSVRVEKAGVHNLTLDLLLGVVSGSRAGSKERPGERGSLTGTQDGFTLDLPRAPITSLELDLAAGIRDVRLGGRPLAESLVTLKPKDGGVRLMGPLGAVDRLDLAWLPKDGNPGPTMVADSEVQVVIDHRPVTTEARITLQAQSGQVGQWRLLVPLRAELRIAAEDQPRVARVESNDQKDVSLRTIHLKEPSSDPLTVTIHTTGAPPRPGLKLVVGPYSVLGAVRHSTSVLVHNATADLVPAFSPGGELVRRDLTVAERKSPSLVAAFRSGVAHSLDSGAALPARNAPPGKARLAGTLPWLEMELEPARGQMKTRIEHLLELTDDPGGEPPAGEDPRPGGPAWRLSCRITATPRQADVDRLLVHLPTGWEYVADEIGNPPEKVHYVHYDQQGRNVEFKLNRGSATGEGPALKPFTVTLVARYPLRNDGGEKKADPGALLPQTVSLRLPRPQGTIEEGGEIRVRVPANVEVLSPGIGADARPDRPTPAGLELVGYQPHELAWRTGRPLPDHLDLAWRPYRPEIRLAVRVNLTLTGAQGTIRHELQLQGPGAGSTTLGLRIPESVAPGLRVLSGGTLSAVAGPGLTRTVALTGTGPLVLEYSFRPAREGKGKGAAIPARFQVPLVVPEQAQGEIRVRVWGEPGELPKLVQGDRLGGWTEQAIEEVAGQDRLPALVVRADQLDLPLVLHLGSGKPIFTVLVERTLVQAGLDPGGTQHYRVRYRLARLVGRHLDLELPAPVPVIRLQVALGGKRVDYDTLSEGDSPAGDRAGAHGRVARLRLPDAAGEPFPEGPAGILEVSYQLSPGQGGVGPLWSSLAAPGVRGAPPGVPTRWQVLAPSGWVLLSPEAEQRSWSLRGWLWAPRLTTPPAELESWLTGPPRPAALKAEGQGTSDDRAAEDWSVTGTAVGDSAGLVCWREGSEGVLVTHLPQQTWLLLCSLAVLLLGIGLGWLGWWAFGESGKAKRSRTAGPVVFVLVLGGLAFGALCAALIRPTLVGQVVYGCQPGLLVLLLLAGVQWALHERRRRQVLFLPSFSRTRTGSSMGRKNQPRPPSGEMPARGSGNLPGIPQPSTVDAPQPVGSSVERRGPTA
jgi:hypothetical protein